VSSDQAFIEWAFGFRFIRENFRAGQTSCWRNIELWSLSTGAFGMAIAATYFAGLLQGPLFGEGKSAEIRK